MQRKRESFAARPRLPSYLIVVLYAHAERVDEYRQQYALLEPSVVDEQLDALPQQRAAHQTVDLQAAHRVGQASFVLALRPVVVHHWIAVRLPVHLVGRKKERKKKIK